MTLTLIRDEKGGSYTAGRLYVDGEYVCDTLEDRWRDLLGQLGSVEHKIYGETCIPEGVYEVRTDIVSPKYAEKFNRYSKHSLAFTKGRLPRLMRVPFFDGILIHTGNTHTDTFGCILVGKRDGGKLKGGSSLPAFKNLYERLLSATDKITIEIKSQWII